MSVLVSFTTLHETCTKLSFLQSFLMHLTSSKVSISFALGSTVIKMPKAIIASEKLATIVGPIHYFASDHFVHGYRKDYLEEGDGHKIAIEQSKYSVC